jgi:hypothetical protein
MAATTSSSCRTGRSVRTGSRSRRCWRRQRASPPDPQGPAHLRRPGRGNRRSARSASLLPAWPAMAPKRSTPIWPSTRCSTCTCRGDFRRKSTVRGRRALHQVDRQGHPQGDVQDGHLDLPVLLRRADLRRGRPVERFRRQLLHRHGDHDRRHRPDEVAEETVRRHRSGLFQRSGASMRWKSAANTPTGCAARSHVWTPDAVADAAACGARQLPEKYREFAAR